MCAAHPTRPRHLPARPRRALPDDGEGEPTSLLRRLRALPWSRIGSAARLRARGHGRVESRTISVVSLRPIPDFEGTEFFPHTAQAIKLVRRRRSLTGRWHTATVYAITSLPGWQADPALVGARNSANRL